MKVHKVQNRSGYLKATLEKSFYKILVAVPEKQGAHKKRLYSVKCLSS